MCTFTMIDFYNEKFLGIFLKLLLWKLCDTPNKLDQIWYVNEQYPIGFQK